MPRVIVTATAAEGLKSCLLFLNEKSTKAAKRASQIIDKKLTLLETEPNIGRPYSDTLELRELVIHFGDSGYIGLYRYDVQEDIVYLLAFRHQKEVSY